MNTGTNVTYSNCMSVLSSFNSANNSRYGNQKLTKESTITNKITNIAYSFCRGAKNIYSRTITKMHHAYTKCSTFTSHQCNKVVNLLGRAVNYLKNSPQLQILLLKMLLLIISFALFYR